MTHRIDGERIYLRDARPSDVTARYVAWLNDPEVNQFLETRFQQHSAGDVLRYVETMAAGDDSVLLAIVRVTDNLHLGNLRIGEINRHHGTATIALVIGEKSVWKNGFATEAIRLAARYAFDALHLRKLTARCYATNSGSLNAFRKAGWTEEGVQRQQFVSDGRIVDGIWLGLTRA